MTSKRADGRQIFWWACAAAVLALLYLLRGVLLPFLLAGLVGWLFQPLVARLARRCPRTLAVLAVLLALGAAAAAALLVVLPLAVSQLARLPAELPLLAARLVRLLPAGLGAAVQSASLPDARALQPLIAAHWQSVESVLMEVLRRLHAGGAAVVEGFADLVLVPLLSFYALRDWPALMSGLRALVPVRRRAPVAGLCREVDAVLGVFLRGQLSVMLCMGLFYMLALKVAGLAAGLSIGFVAGLFSFVPYLGVLTGILLSLLSALLQTQDASLLLPVLGVFVLAHLLEGYVLEPWLIGHRIGLHPAAVIFAVMAGGALFGFFGVLLALPAAAALNVGLRRLHRAWLARAAAGEAP